MIIGIDAGNTRCKWKAWDQAKVMGQGFFAHDDGLPQDMRHLLRDDRKNHHVLIASVANPELTDRMQLLFEGCQLTVVKSRRHCLGVTNRYAEPERLGVDRWLAMIEAWHHSEGKPCCVMDLGTAATLDVVDGKGQHIGGYIVPGLSLMRGSLGSSTERVYFSDSAELSVDYGIDTTTAVQNGIHAMMIDWLNGEIARFRQNWQDGRVYLTGGDGRLLLPLLADKGVMHYPDLVLDALLRLARA